MNSFSGNPVIYKDEIYYGGNFHAQLLANAADLLKISASNMAFLSEKKNKQIVKPKFK